jgi:hypothetical protein
LVALVIPANDTIATKQQIDATKSEVGDAGMSPAALDAQLATAQNVALKEQVDKHSARLSSSISSAIANTRKLLTLLRESVDKDTPSGKSELAAVDGLWEELEHLFNAAKQAQSALPEFLGKQEDNMRLYHNASVNEAMQELQGELNLQHKKVNIQYVFGPAFHVRANHTCRHDLILDHQHVFQDYKSRTDAKLKTLAELDERVSRLTLDKGLLKTELDNYRKQLKEAMTAQSDNAKTTTELQKELQTAITSKQELASENESLRSAVGKLQKNLKDEELLHMARCEELAGVVEARNDDAEAREGLENLVKELRVKQSATTTEIEAIKAESENLQQKFKNLSYEYSAIFAVCVTLELFSRILTLTSSIEVQPAGENTHRKRQQA